MMKQTILFLLLLAGGWTVHPAQAQTPTDSERTKQEILQSLRTQSECWNRGDILGFMSTYWKDDRLTFSSGGETRQGWQATLDRYQKSYPREKMGNLRFDQESVEILSDQIALVLGDWHLDLNGELKDGNFSLVLRKIDGRWLIIHDHSSIRTPPKPDNS